MRMKIFQTDGPRCDYRGENIMRRQSFTSLAALAALVSAVGCANSPGTVEKKQESSTETAQGKVETKTEQKQVGNTLEATSQTKADTPGGTVKTKTETYVGTVTVYTPGKKIEIMTGEKKMHSFNLDDKDVMANVAGGIVVGSRVKLVEETGDDKTHRITVSLQG
jgi:hypothetical protein